MTTAEQLADKIENRPDNAIIYGDQAAAELRRLAAENERLRADAERYRWLREGCDHKNTPADNIVIHQWGQDWDAAIDAAMKEQP